MIAGVGQVLAGSLAHIVPVLLGPPLEPAGSILTRRHRVPLILLNLGGLALAMGWERIAVIAVGLWVLDMLLRVVTLVRSRHDEPPVAG